MLWASLTRPNKAIKAPQCRSTVNIIKSCKDSKHNLEVSHYHFNANFKPVPLKETELFQPIKVGSIEAQHRVVLSPVTRLRNVNNVPKTHLLAEYYGQRSRRPGALSITEAAFISAAAAGAESAPSIYSRNRLKPGPKSTNAFMPIIHLVFNNYGPLVGQHLSTISQHWP